MTIGELARRFGLRPSALRFYERAKLLESPIRVGGRRAYDNAAVRRVGFIRSAQQSGLTLAEIKSLIRDGGAGIAPRQLWKKITLQKLAEIDRKIAGLRASRAALAKTQACRCRSFTRCETQLANTLESARSHLPAQR